MLAAVICFATLCALCRGRDLSINWICLNDTDCRRVIGPASDNKISLGVCRLTCGTGNTLWPFPTGKIAISKELVTAMGVSVDISVKFGNGTKSTEECMAAITRLCDNLFDGTIKKAFEAKVDPSLTVGPFKIVAEIEDPLMELSLDTYEGYLLEKRELDDDDGIIQIRIVAENFFGFRNAIYTFRNLITFDEVNTRIAIPKTFSITDEPRYPIRSVMVDTGHNYLSVDSIKRLITGLSYSKINTVRWHFSDWQSFPLAIAGDAFTRYGAYGADKVYTLEQIVSLVAHARMEGIRLIPEIPIPGRMGSGWQWGPDAGLGDLVVCFNQRPYRCEEPPCGQLNIENSEAVKLVKNLYSILPAIFGNGLYHLGGADVNLSCWPNLSREKAYELWANLLNEIADFIISHGGQVIVFSNDLLDDGREWLSPEKFIIQVTDSDPTYAEKLANRGYRIILSPANRTRWDCGFGTWSPDVIKPISRVLGWQAAYGIPRPNISESGRLLGGEGLLYSDGVDSYNLEERMLLNAAGLSERFWTDPEWQYLEAQPRIDYYSWMRKADGYHVNSVQPYWCTQNVGTCFQEQ